MGNAPLGDDSGSVHTEPTDIVKQSAARELRLINRTWPLRYSAWEPVGSVAPRSAAGSGMGVRGASKLPQGFHDVKAYLDAAAQSHAVDPALLYSVAAAESAFNADAVSHKGALGLMQIMPATAARYGVTGYSLDTGRHNVLEPHVNAQVGSRYLADLLRRYSGDPSLAIAAYNAGEGAVAKYGNRIPPYPETQRYVERVMGFYRSFKQ
ncbi:lytic transglycosylase domain-containing protein [Ottowia sp. GY511]|nr:lytic transglycosylase domain-containing protein [Ottowia sp. GY511]